MLILVTVFVTMTGMCILGLVVGVLFMVIVLRVLVTVWFALRDGGISVAVILVICLFVEFGESLGRTWSLSADSARLVRNGS